MMRAHRLLVVAAVAGCAGSHAVGGLAPVPRPSSRVPVDSVLAGLTVRQSVAQLVTPWLSGSYTSLDDSLFQVAVRWGLARDRRSDRVGRLAVRYRREAQRAATALAPAAARLGGPRVGRRDA